MGGELARHRFQGFPFALVDVGQGGGQAHAEDEGVTFFSDDSNGGCHYPLKPSSELAAGPGLGFNENRERVVCMLHKPTGTPF
jgi:hypothetical protein